jgi:hypothetical protein
MAAASLLECSPPRHRKEAVSLRNPNFGKTKERIFFEKKKRIVNIVKEEETIGNEKIIT